MMHFRMIPIVIIILTFVIKFEIYNAVKETSSVASVTNLNTNPDLKPRKGNRTRKRPIGSQTYEARKRLKIHQLLKDKTSGVKTLEEAEKVAKEFLNQKIKEKSDKNRERIADRKSKNIYTPTRTKPGYRSKKQRIERNTKALMENDKTLSEQKARALAIENYITFRKNESESQKNRRAIKSISGYQGKKSRIDRRIMTLMKKDENLSKEDAFKIANEHYEAHRKKRNDYQNTYRAVMNGRL